MCRPTFIPSHNGSRHSTRATLAYKHVSHLRRTRASPFTSHLGVDWQLYRRNGNKGKPRVQPPIERNSPKMSLSKMSIDVIRDILHADSANPIRSKESISLVLQHSHSFLSFILSQSGYGRITFVQSNQLTQMRAFRSDYGNCFLVCLINRKPNATSCKDVDPHLL